MERGGCLGGVYCECVRMCLACLHKFLSRSTTTTFDSLWHRSYSLYLRLKVWGCTEACLLFGDSWESLNVQACRQAYPDFSPSPPPPFAPPPTLSPPHFFWRFTYFSLFLRLIFRVHYSFFSRHFSQSLILKKYIILVWRSYFTESPSFKFSTFRFYTLPQLFYMFCFISLK
jgi:hypothetical protein